MKKSELLKTEHTVQFRWLTNQISKIGDTSIQKNFLNFRSAIRGWEKLNSDLVVRDADLEHYIHIHMSEQGIRKLVTTLRVCKKRRVIGTERLQVEITLRNAQRLDEIVKISGGKTKIEIINYLIRNADLSEFDKEIVTV